MFENRGRDVAPFIEQMSPIISDYTYICHIHSKKPKLENMEMNGESIYLDICLDQKNI